MKKIILFILLVLIILGTYKSLDEEITIPKEAIRLRVIPNSNSSIDQNIKNKVKNYLENNTYELLKNENNIEEARKIITENIPTLETNISKIFEENNYDMTYNVKYGYNYFPNKEYRGIKYKEGYYESIVISIGKAEGDNWWCVLFPNLCLADLEQKDNIEYKSWILEAINKIFS